LNNLLRDIEGINPYRLILEQLQTVYGYPEDAVITETSQEKILEGLKRDKSAIEGQPGRIKDSLLKRLMVLFNPKSDFYGDYQVAIENWYKNLGDEQQDEYASWHSNSSRAVVQRLRTIVNIETTFFEQLPRDAGFGLGKIDDWHRDRSDEYVQMLNTALERIEANRVKVTAPSWDVRGFAVSKKEIQRNNHQISFRRGATLVVRVPGPGVKVLLTDTNEDPRTAQQRQTVDKQFELSIDKGCIVKLVSQGPDGSCGQVITLSFVNEDRKYEPTPLTQQGIFEREYKYVFPKDKDALQVLLYGILKEVMQQNLVSEEEARKLLIQLAEELKRLY
jgi:hypothetical protein